MMLLRKMLAISLFLVFISGCPEPGDEPGESPSPSDTPPYGEEPTPTMWPATPTPEFSSPEPSPPDATPTPEVTPPSPTPGTMMDVDGDGFFSGPNADPLDCDDTNPNTYPGADEVCDGTPAVDDEPGMPGTDNDCDGEVDEDAIDASTWYADMDGDGYGDPDASSLACLPPDAYVTNSDDCDDQDPSINPNTTWYADMDGDGYGDPAAMTAACLAPENHVSNADDCDDQDASLNPVTFWYVDQDQDGSGDPASAVQQCEGPEGYVKAGTDCNDDDPAFHPGATESCTDEYDFNCDGSTAYEDQDQDGFAACEECDDDDPMAYPDATEVCNGEDTDCDGSIDLPVPPDAPLWYTDQDGDSFGAGEPVASCSRPEADPPLVAQAGDCDDTAATTSPAADEICDGGPDSPGIDNDCDGEVDEDDAIDAPTWYQDADDDGYGNADISMTSCSAPEGYIADAGDCADDTPEVNPAADELCDGIDNNCDGMVDGEDATDLASWHPDQDGDGYGDSGVTTLSCAAPEGYLEDSSDCDDTDPAINPGAEEVCDGGPDGPGLDNNCNGQIDESEAVDAATWYPDTDGDSYGNGASSHPIVACQAPDGYVAENTDCNDGNPSIHPDADERCDGVDNNCDGEIDEGLIVTWYLDYDRDGFGDDGRTAEGCRAPSGDYVSVGGDCDDTDPERYPDAEERCDGGDYNCDGLVDHDADGDGFADAECGGLDCDDADPAVRPEPGGGCAMGETCLSILELYPDAEDGTYVIDPDGYGEGVEPFSVTCDMAGGGWTGIEYASDLPFEQHFTGGDAWRYVPAFDFVLTDAQIDAIQAVSTEGKQTYVGLCEHVIHYYYTDGGNYDYAFGFMFFDGTETPRGLPSYAPYSVQVLADGCKTNGGEGGDPGRSTVFEIHSPLLPVLTVQSRDSGDTFPEEFGSPLTENPAWLR